MKCIGIVATSNTMRIIDKQLIEIGIKKLKDLGFNVKFGLSIFESNVYNSLNIQERVKDINLFLDDNEVDIIMSAYGGYNSNDLLEYLDYEKIKLGNKKIIGYSDFTAIINSINEIVGIKTYLGPAFITFCDPSITEETVKNFIDVVIEEKNTVLNSPEYCAYDDWYLKSGFEPRDWKKHNRFISVNHGKAIGTAVGGNLETLLTLAGTKYFPSTKNKILFLEAVADENISRFRRNLVQLMQMQVFNNINGIVIGQFSNENLLSNKKALIDIFKDIIEKYNIPIISNVNISHTSPLYTIPIGGIVQIESNNNCKIEIKGGF